MAEKITWRGILIMVFICIFFLGVGLTLGWFGYSWIKKPCSEVSCPNGCYNGGTIFESDKCTCTKGFSGQCCELKTQLCKFGQWSEWTNCSEECGLVGTQYRIRENNCFDSDHCSQKTYEQRSCNVFCYGGFMSHDGCVCQSGYTGKCCGCKIKNCQMTPWSKWSTCTRTCGPHGTRFRTRSIVSYASCGGEPCSDVLTEEEDCNRECYNGTLSLIDGNYTCKCQNGFTGECCDCKIHDCVMSQWTDWLECTHVCGPHGITFRTRDVHTHPKCGGAECPAGTLSEQKECNRMCKNGGHLDYDNGVCRCQAGYSGHCCDCKDVDCKLSEWSGWSTCENATQQVRSRDVTRYPKCKGRECTGSLTEDRSCAVPLKYNILVPKWSIASFGAFCLLLIVCGAVVYFCYRRKTAKHDHSKTALNQDQLVAVPQKQIIEKIQNDIAAAIPH